MLQVAFAGAADADSRCELLGQSAVSAFLQFAQSLSSGDQGNVDGAIARLAGLTSIYSNVGCDAQTLGRTIDCVLDGAGQDKTRDVARGCLAREGLIGAAE